MREPQRVERGLVDRVDQPPDPVGHEPRERIELPRERDDARDQEVRDGDRREEADVRPKPLFHSPVGRAGRAEVERELPHERIEVPGLAVRVRREVPLEAAREEIDESRARARDPRGAAHRRQRERKGGQDHDVKREDVQVYRPEPQQRGLDNGAGGLLDEADQVHLLDKRAAVGAERHPRDLRGKRDEQHDVRDVELPHPPQHLRRRDRPSFPQEHSGVGDDRGVARDEHEDLGGVAEAVVAHGDPAHRVVGNVVEKDEPQREPAEEVEPQVAAAALRGRDTAALRSLVRGGRGIGRRAHAVRGPRKCFSNPRLPPGSSRP